MSADGEGGPLCQEHASPRAGLRASRIKLARTAKSAGSGPGPRPSLMDIPDQPWQRRFAGRGADKLAAALLLGQHPQPLVECEPGHFVAVEDEL